MCKLTLIMITCMMVTTTLSKIRVEDSKFWPISEPVPIQEVDRVTAFKKLNIGLGV